MNILNQAIILNSELKHYGVLGMKWGVRRTPEQLGHKPKYLTEPAIIKAGSRVYRVTKTKRENNFSDTFVFTDRNDAVKFGRELNKITGGKLFMMDMQVTKDIIGASEKQRVDDFLANYRNKPSLKEITDIMCQLAPEQGITLGTPGENLDLLKYRAYTIAVAKNFGSARQHSMGGPVEEREYSFGKVEVATNPKYGMVVDDYMRGNTKLSKESIEIDSLDTAVLIFSKTRQSSLKTKKVSKLKHSKNDNTSVSTIVDLWPASGGNSIQPIPISKIKK